MVSLEGMTLAQHTALNGVRRNTIGSIAHVHRQQLRKWMLGEATIFGLSPLLNAKARRCFVREGLSGCNSSMTSCSMKEFPTSVMTSSDDKPALWL